MHKKRANGWFLTILLELIILGQFPCSFDPSPANLEKLTKICTVLPGVEWVSFRVGLHSVIAWMIRNYLLENDWNGNQFHNHLVRQNTQPFSQAGQMITECHSKTRMWHDKNTQSMHGNNLYFQCSSIIWPVWLNDGVFVYELIGCGFNYRCCHLSFRHHVCFEQKVLWHSDNCRV